MGTLIQVARRSFFWKGLSPMLLFGMIVLGLAAFAAILGFVRFCDWV
jgi:hypothetical protein